MPVVGRLSGHGPLAGPVGGGIGNRPSPDDVTAAWNLQETLFVIGNDSRRTRGRDRTAGPRRKLEPDVSWIYATPGQTLKLLMGLAYQEGEAPGNHVSGQASVCQCIARTLRTGRVCVDISCVGDRRYGLVQDDEMIITIPARQVGAGGQGDEGLRPLRLLPVPTLPGLQRSVPARLRTDHQ